jgi:hypothetical protein
MALLAMKGMSRKTSSERQKGFKGSWGFAAGSFALELGQRKTLFYFRCTKGLIPNPPNKYPRGHYTFCKRIFFVDGVELADAATADATEGGKEAPCFLLQAVADMPMTDTMQLVVPVGAASLVTLLDSGSTHNFISEEAVRWTGLPLRPRPRITTMIANGEWITCVGIIRDAPLLIDGAAFPTDLYVMPLAGYDIVLGTKWLGALGPIVLDLASRRMSFQRASRTISWA